MFVKTLRFGLVVAAVALHWATASAQESPIGSLRAWGLLGSWSKRCDLPTSRSNFRYIIVASPDGRAYLERDFGAPGTKDRSQILSAKPRADGTIALTINFTSFGQVRLNVYAKSEGRTRVIYNSRTDNSDVTVENGLLKHNGQPTPWQYKCRGAS